MNQIAIKMLMGDRAKYLGLIFGIMFATLLMAQQMSLFVGIMSRTYATIDETNEVDPVYKNFEKIHTGHILDKLGLNRYCCRRNLIANIDMMDII